MEQKKLGFGLMRLPVLDPKDTTKIDMAQMEEMVDTFLERGFTYFDTAYVYHKFQSEIAMREALVKRHPRESFTVATKLPVIRLEAEGDRNESLMNSLKNAASLILITICFTIWRKKAMPTQKNLTVLVLRPQKKPKARLKIWDFPSTKKRTF